MDFMQINPIFILLNLAHRHKNTIHLGLHTQKHFPLSATRGSAFKKSHLRKSLVSSDPISNAAGSITNFVTTGVVLNNVIDRFNICLEAVMQSF